MTSKQIAEFVGIAAVVVSLVFVALEIRQSNRIAIATAEAELRSASRENSLELAGNRDLVEISVKAKDPSIRLDQIEEEMLRNFFRADFNLLTQANQAYENGLLTEYTLDIYKSSIESKFRENTYFSKFAAEIVRDSGIRRGNSQLWDFLLDQLVLHGHEI